MIQVSSDLLRPETFVHRHLKYMLNFSYWRSVGLKHIKCLAKKGHRALSLLPFNAHNANKVSWFCSQGSHNSELELISCVCAFVSLLVCWFCFFFGGGLFCCFFLKKQAFAKVHPLLCWIQVKQYLPLWQSLIQ